MPKLVFTPEEINDFLKLKKEVFGCFYEKSLCLAENMAVHADGIYPKRLIDERRPNEPLEVKAYRKEVFVPITKPIVSKVFSSLQKIRRSQDWSIRYPDAAEFPKITEQESLEYYCEYNYPLFTSLTNWAFTVGLRKGLIDCNGVVFVSPRSYIVGETDYIEPTSQVFESCDVLYFEPEDYAILKIQEGCLYYTGAKNNKPVRGMSMYVVNTVFIARYDQVSARDFAVTVFYEHGLEMLPVFKFKGVVINQMMNQYLYESRISGMIPGMDEAVREYSDLQAGVVNHLYLERYEYTQTECKSCKGTGIRPNPRWTSDCGCEKEITCNAAGCQHGYIVPGPYSKTILRPQQAMEGMQPAPWPPIGYVGKDPKILELQDTRVDAHIYKALASINFEFLADTPLAQSGVAKETDRQELDNTCNSIAEDIVALLDSVYRVIARYRYKMLYSMDDIEEMLPIINVPEKFDMLSTSVEQDKLTKAKTAKINPVLLSAMEIDYAGKEFNTDPDVRDMVTLVLKLDPLPNIGDDDKMTRLSNKGITQETYIISSNIQAFVQRAINENPKFAGLKLDEQQTLLEKYAQEQLKEALDAMIPMDDPNNNIYGQPV